MAGVRIDWGTNTATVDIDRAVTATRAVDLGRALVHVDDRGAIARVEIVDARIEQSGQLWWWLTEVLRRCRWDGDRPQAHIG